MPTLTHLTDAVASEALAFADLLDSLDAVARTAQTPCAGWTIDDLAAHVASGAFRDAESFHRARLGTSSPPGELALSGDTGAAIRLSIGHLRAALDDPPAHWPAVPMAFGPYPVEAALGCLIVEFGTHRNDLEIAVGNHHVALSRATLDALLGFGEFYLLLQAAPLESGPVTFTLSAPSTTMSISWDGRSWTRGTGAARMCRIAGSDDAIARLMLRRLDVTDPQLTLDDPAHLAPVFPNAIRPL